MKYLIFIFSCLHTLLAHCQVSEAQLYLNFLQKEEIAFGDELIKLTKMLKQPDANLLQQYQAFKNQVHISYNNIDDKSAFPKSKYLKEAALDYFEAWQHIAKHDLKELTELYIKEKVTQEDVALASEYFKKVQQHIQHKEEDYRKAQQKFAADHLIMLSENPFKFYLQ